MMKTLRFAFYQTVPVLLGYTVLGIAFGVVLQRAGYGAPWALLSSVVVFAGSAQFVMADLIATGASLLTVFVMTLFINSRHIFYGLTFVERFRGTSARTYRIFSLTDETYSLLCSLQTPAGMDENALMLLIALLDQSYWVMGSVLGALIGELIPFDLTGIDFSMTALFVVILIDQLRGKNNRLPALIGGASAILCLILFGADGFLLPALVIAATVLTILCPKTEVTPHE